MITVRVKMVFLLIFFSIYQLSGQTVSGTINSYYKVTAINVATNHLTLNSTAGLAPGAWVMIIQMKGATVNSSATASFGDITAINQAGNYEINNVCGVNASNQVFLTYPLLKTYNTAGYVQLVTIPRYRSVTVADTVKSAAWNKSAGTGGIAALWATDTIFLNSAVDVSGKGFNGGAFVNFTTPTYDCSWTTDIASYFLSIIPSPNNFYHGGMKGESISDYIPDAEYARGKQANGGGGGNNHNSGGAGGANYGSGGNGGRRSNEGSFLCHGPNGGLGGISLSGSGYTVANNRIFMGGGGGSGHQNNSRGTEGAHGGGIILLIANVVMSANTQLKANGNQPYNSLCLDPWQAEGDGGGGGGAGGTILLSANQVVGNLSVQTNGGAGSNASNRVSDCTGPGGGGGGGVIWVKGASIPANISTSVTGGVNGTVSMGSNTVACRGLANNATPGAAGIAIPNYVLPMSSTLLCYALGTSDLKFFTAVLIEKKVKLSWQLRDPSVINKIYIEKTTNQVQFKTISVISLFNSEPMQEPDSETPRVVTYYRLKILKNDGSVVYSQQVLVEPLLEADFTLLQVRPNPSTGFLIAEFIATENCIAKMTIISVTGVTGFRKEVSLKKGFNLITLPTASLSAGLYLLIAEADGRKQIAKFIRQ